MLLATVWVLMSVVALTKGGDSGTAVCVWGLLSKSKTEVHAWVSFERGVFLFFRKRGLQTVCEADGHPTQFSDEGLHSSVSLHTHFHTHHTHHTHTYTY